VSRSFYLLLACVVACESEEFPQPEPILGPPPPRFSITVTISDQVFNPVPVTITQGSRVFWINKGFTGHAITFDAPITFSSGWLSPNEQANRQFNALGTFTYHCLIHPEKRGTIQVISRTFIPTL
jgi:plastocyanin